MTRNLLAALVATLCLSVAGPAALAADGATTPSPAPTTTIAPDPTAPDVPDAQKRITVGLQTATRTGPDDRVRYDYEIAPKGVRQDFVAVVNYSDREAEVTLAARDATSTPDNAYTVQTDDQRSTDVGSWISLARTSLRMAPRTRTLIPFQVGVPFDATPGDHVGAIVLTVLTQGLRDGKGVVVSNRVGLRMRVRVPGQLRPELRIDDLRTEFYGPFRSFGVGRLQTTYTVRNVGNVAVSGRQTVAYLRSFGLSPLSAPAGGIPSILPGGFLRFRTGGDRAFVAWDVTTRVTATPVSKEIGTTPIERAVATTTLRHIPWALIAAIVATVLLAAWLGRRIVRALRRRLGGSAGPDGDDADGPDDPQDPDGSAAEHDALDPTRDPEPAAPAADR